MQKGNIVNNSIEKVYSLSPLQEGMLYYYISDENTQSYVVQHVYELNEYIDDDLAKLSLKLLALRHNALRTSIIYEKLSVPMNVIVKDKEIEYETINFSSLPQSVEQIKLTDILSSDIERGFDLQKDSLLRVKAIRLRENKQILVLTNHHIIMDGWCTSIVYNDFIHYYLQLKNGTEFSAIMNYIANELSKQGDYGEYIRWLENQDKNAGLEYWRELLDNYQENAEVMPISEPKITDKQVDVVVCELPKELSAKIISFANKNKLTLNSVMETAWGVILQRYSNANDVIFGKVVSGRNASINGIDDIVGLFINTIPVRIRTEKDTTVLSLISEVQKQGIESNNFSYCSLADIQRTTKPGSQLIKTLFTFENYYKHEIVDEKVNKLESTMVSSREQTTFPISINIYQGKDVLGFEIEFDPNIYTINEMERLLKLIENTLNWFVENPNSEVSELDIITNEEKKKILNEFNNTQVEYPMDKTVIELFEAQVKKTPNNVAVVYEEQTITYAELNQKVNQLARKLRESGIKPNDFVALIAERSIEMIIGIYGIMKAGGAYVPIDPEYPEERIQYMLEDCRPKIVLTYNAEIQINLPTVNLSEKEIYTGETANLEVLNKPEDLVYCTYTSGTTGKPKGILIEHRGLHNLMVAYTEIYDLSSTDTVLQVANYIFDQSVWDIFNILLVGGTLCMISREDIRTPSAIEKYCNQNHVTIASFTPVMIAELDADKFPTLRILDSSGEAANAEILKKWAKNRAVINTYGPTEITVNASSYRYNGENVNNIPIGKPIANMKYYVINNNDSLCGIGIPGELCIAGPGVARGYLNNPQLTAEKFVENPFEEGRMYKTGDLTRWLPDGNIEYLGRIDEQVKIRGYRIELGEIENALRRIPVIKDCAVIVKTDSREDKAIYAYLVGEQEISPSEIRERLSVTLPEYMIPAYIAQIEIIPMTRSGKLDRRSLPAIENQRERAYVVPTTEEEQVLCQAFSEILGIENVGSEDNFFELGGDSIKSIRVVSKVREAGYELTVRDIMRRNVVKAIAQNMVKAVANAYNQGEITGKIQPTPIIRDFGNKRYEVPHYYNQSTLIRLEKGETETIQKALDALVKHHDILRSVYKENTLEILSIAESSLYDYYEIEAKEDEYRHKIEKECMKIQCSINLEKGPLVKAAKISTANEKYLFVCIHHLVVDGVSWRILTEDIVSGINQAEAGKDIVLSEKTASFKEWAEALMEYRESKKLEKEKVYWQQIVNNLSEGMISSEATEESGYGKITIEFDHETTEKLLYKSGKAYNTEINDLLLTALGMAAKQLTGQNKLSVMLEGHGREEIHKKIAIDRTVGWFTSEFPVIVESGESIEENIINTKEMLRKVPNRGIGYGLLKEEDKEISLIFNYMGEMDAERKEIETEQLHVGRNVSEKNYLGEPIRFNGETVNECMSFEVMFDKRQYSGETIFQFANLYKRWLEDVVEICVSQKFELNTASDWSANDLETEDYLEILNSIS